MRLLDIIFYLLRKGSKITMNELAEYFNSCDFEVVKI